jgi:receptor protein-tyrosine kinase
MRAGGQTLQVDLRDYVAIVRLHRWLIVLSTLAVTVLALGVTVAQTPQYEATTRLFISTAASDEATLNQGGQFSIQRVQSYADLLNGDEISRRVVNRLHLDERPRELTDQIEATAKLNTVILVINVTDPSAARAQVLANAVAREFVSFVGELETPPGKAAATVKATIVDAASRPSVPVSPKPLRNIALGLVLGAMLGAGLAVLRESFDSSIKSTKLLEELSGAPMLGAITFDPKAVDHPLITSLDPYSPRVEAFRVLRTNLQFINPGQDHKVFVVTSSLPGEGKTTTATNLAIALAEGGDQVVLLEGDLRRPKVSEYLRVAGSVGVTTVILGRVGIDGAIQSVQDGLDVLTSGRVPPNPAELIKSEGMGDIVDKLRRKYDYVIIDAPPLLPVTDASLLATRADGAILVARYGETTHDQVAAAANRIEQVNARLIGVVLNMTPKGGAGRYGYGYGYGYGYAPEGSPNTSRRASRKQAKKDKKREAEAEVAV